MTLDEAIKHCEEVAEEQSRLYSLCPCPCDGTKDCMSLENGKDLGCTKCAAGHRQLAEWLKELKELKARRGQWKYYKNIGIMNIYICTNCNNEVEMAIDVEPSSFCYCPKCKAVMNE